MTKTHKFSPVATFAALLGAFALFTTPAIAKPLEQGQWGGALLLGAQAQVSGDVHGGATAPIANLGALNPALAGVSATLEIQSRSYDEIYGAGAAGQLELAYGLGGGREVFGAVGYSRADEGQVQVGGARVPALNATLPVLGRFSEFSQTTVEAGLRQYFGAGALRPYIAARVGVAVTDDVSATFTIPAANIRIQNAPFYDGSTTLTVGADVGVSFAVSDRVALGAEAGLRYVGELEGNDTAIGGLGLGAINNDGSRVTVPVKLTARIAF